MSGPWRTPQQVEDELDRGVVGPVHVVQQQDDRSLPGQQLEQRTQRPVEAIALARPRRGRRRSEAHERGEHGAEFLRRTLGERLRMTPGMVTLGPPAAIRTLRWLGAWEKRDPQEAHSHVGPLAVDCHLQGQGIGSVLLAEYCRRLDAASEVGYLETDKPANVRFYQRAGYTVTGEQDVLGFPNWFMHREPRRG